MSDEHPSDEGQSPSDERASSEDQGFEDDFERIRQDLLPTPPPPPDDPATALASIDDWNDAWISLVDEQDTERIALSRELKDFIEQTNYLARWCESAGLDSTALIEFSHAARDAYYAFQPTLPRIPEVVWVLLERLKYRLQPFELRPITELTPAPEEDRRQPIPDKEEANILVRDYLKKHPRATIRKVARELGISTGSVSNLPAWQAVMEKRRAAKAPTRKRERQFTPDMEAAVGRKSDPTARLQLEEAVWQRLIEEADPRERGSLHGMEEAKKQELINLKIEQMMDATIYSDDERS